jgi:hypothetical protein
MSPITGQAKKRRPIGLLRWHDGRSSASEKKDLRADPGRNAALVAFRWQPAMQCDRSHVFS